jgi:hypothetical protein
LVRFETYWAVTLKRDAPTSRMVAMSIARAEHANTASSTMR